MGKRHNKILPLSKTAYCRKKSDHVRKVKEQFEFPFREALWVYLLDHASIDKKTGNWKAYLEFRNENDLWRRIFARQTKEYIKRDTVHLEQKHKTTLEKIRGRGMKGTISKIENSGSLFQKILLFTYRYSRRKLFEK